MTFLERLTTRASSTATTAAGFVNSLSEATSLLLVLEIVNSTAKKALNNAPLWLTNNRAVDFINGHTPALLGSVVRPYKNLTFKQIGIATVASLAIGYVSARVAGKGHIPLLKTVVAWSRSALQYVRLLPSGATNPSSIDRPSTTPKPEGEE